MEFLFYSDMEGFLPSGKNVFEITLNQLTSVGSCSEKFI